MDFIINNDGELHIGKGHYKLNHKAKTLRGSGRLRINEQFKVDYLDNDSGHYPTTKQEFERIAKVFIKSKLCSETFEWKLINSSL